MATTKLTLSIDPEVVAKARRISKRRKTSVSAMFSRYIATMEEVKPRETPLPPMTRRALALAVGIAPLPENWDYRNELSNILDERYGLK